MTMRDTLAQTSAFLTGLNVELIGHPPYSPDLPPNDFFLFQHIKRTMHGLRFSLKCSETTFWRCLTRSGKSASTSGLSVCSCWRILWKTIKPFLMINVRIVIIRPEIYYASIVFSIFENIVGIKSRSIDTDNTSVKKSIVRKYLKNCLIFKG